MEKSNQSKALNYKFSQVFGYKGPNQKILQEDIISNIKFDHTGNYLAVGDKAGRIIVFQAQQAKKGPPSYEYFTQFQSHVREFDPLRSMQVNEEITGMDWLKAQGRYLKIATANERNIKVWKMFERTQKKIVKLSGKDLSMPKLQNVETSYVAETQIVFPSKHLAPINSISPSKNQQYLLSADQGQILLWSFDKPDHPYLVVNTVPNGGADQHREVNITCSKYHPTSDSLFIYGNNRGSLKMADLRMSANADTSSISFGESTQQKNYIYELLANYTGIDYIRGGKYIVSRDYLTVKLWDVCNPKKPLSTIMLNEGLKSKLSEMVENEAIFDKFALSASPDGNTVITGSYNNNFHLVDLEDGINGQYQLTYKKNTVMKQMTKGATVAKMDYVRKVLACDFSPERNLLATASLNCFFVYSM